MGDYEPSNMNSRLRPRKSYTFYPQTNAKNKLESKITRNKSKKTNTTSKTSQNNQSDDAYKSNFTLNPQFLCPFCDKQFSSKQTEFRHARRMHSKQKTCIRCIFCDHTDTVSEIIKHMVESHPSQYFTCLDCLTRFFSSSELAEHSLNNCKNQTSHCHSTHRQKQSISFYKLKKSINASGKYNMIKNKKEVQDNDCSNGIVISCKFKPSQIHNEADVEDNITTNLILPSSNNLGSCSVFEKNAVVVLDDIQQLNKRLPQNYSFHNADADQILSRLGVVQRSTRTESTKRDWMKAVDDMTQKFEKCFDTKFYSKVTSNVQDNLSKFLDGAFNFNPDPTSTIMTRKSNNSVVINSAEGFPILLAGDQCSRSVFDGYLPRTMVAPKHKWKWDSLENDKNLHVIKRDSHVNNCIVTFVSCLDIWTQLSMRQKFEDKFNNHPLEKKVEKQNTLNKELKEILESRQIPNIPNVGKSTIRGSSRNYAFDFPASLGLMRATPIYEVQPAILSGEWVRPRCYVCCACGHPASDSKRLSLHISMQHPNAHVQYYEIVGEPLLNSDILKYLYVPPSQVYNRTRPLRGFRECTKCNKSVTLENLHQHMLDCAGDAPAVRRRQCRYRPFGVRRRRPRLSDNTSRKKLRNEIIRTQRRQKSLIKPRSRIRTEVGDAETIRKMLADLPAKRHRALLNPVNLLQRPKNSNKDRSKLIMKKIVCEDPKVRNSRFNKGILTENRGKFFRNNEYTVSSLEDQEENKPSKTTFKTILRTTSQRESLKRRMLTKRANRRSMTVEQQKIVGDIYKAGSGLSLTGKACLETETQKIDVKRESYSVRECTNHITAHSKGVQQAERSGTSEAASSASSVASTQHTPLKHSIARLTANSETHDKSMQFHHRFLVQQKCNNANQNTTSTQQKLFENDVFLTIVDKPPLNMYEKGLKDLHNVQKNKWNKPRKGLNDCIAMLKRKLVDHDPFDIPEHVSIQCGDIAIDNEVTSKRNAQSNILAVAATAFHGNSSQKYALENHDPLLTVFPQEVREVMPNFINNECSMNSTSKSGKTQIVMQTVKEYPKTSTANDCKINVGSLGTLETKVGSCNTNYEANIFKKAGVQKNNQKFKVNSENNTQIDSMTLKKQAVIQSECRQHTRVSVDIFTNKVFKIPADIPPAHTSTYTESLITSPLDLSNKICSRKILLRSESSHLSEYHGCETLDLTNKKPTERIKAIVQDDTVVDLSVNSFPSRSPRLTLDLCAKSTSHEIGKVSEKLMQTNTSTIKPSKGPETGKDSTIINSFNNRFYVKPDIHSSPASIVTSVENSSLSKEIVHLGKLSRKTQTNELKAIHVFSVPEVSKKSVKDKTDPEFYITQTKVNDDLSESVKQITMDTSNACIDPLPKTMQKSVKIKDVQLSVPTQTQIIENFLKAPKHVYDPAFKIPIFKLRDSVSMAETIRLSVVGDSVALVTNNAKEKSLSPAVESILDNSNSKITRPISDYKKSYLEKRNESNMPVYTLANSCITMPKTDALNNTDFANVILSMSGSTIPSTLPVYTHTGSLIATTQRNSGIMPECNLHNDLISTGSTDLSLSCLIHDNDYRTSDYTFSNITNESLGVVKKNASVGDCDPAIAKQINMLPKELVEVLKNINIDHRNQLLNVLSQYVSPCVREMCPSARVPAYDVVTNLCPKEVISHIICNVGSIKKPPILCFSNDFTPSLEKYPSGYKLAGHMEVIKNNSFRFNLPQDSVNENVEIKSLSISVPQSSKEESANIELANHSTRTIKSKNGLSDYIIDLTHDDTVSGKVNLTNVKVSASSSFSPEKSNPGIQIEVSMQDCYDKTASLRAVRIKGPLERQKEIQILRRDSTEQTRSIPELIKNEENINQCIVSNKVLAIQQAQISSTQQHSKTTPFNTKSSVEFSEVKSYPNESDIQLRRTSTLADTVIKRSKLIFTKNVIDKSTSTSTILAYNNNTDFDKNKKVVEEKMKLNNYRGTLQKYTAIPAIESYKNKIKLTTNKKIEDTVVVDFTPMKKKTEDVILPLLFNEDDDSEDDVILASIVKKKQLSEQKTVENITEKALKKSSRQKPMDETDGISVGRCVSNVIESLDGIISEKTDHYNMHKLDSRIAVSTEDRGNLPKLDLNKYEVWSNEQNYDSEGKILCRNMTVNCIEKTATDKIKQLVGVDKVETKPEDIRATKIMQDIFYAGYDLLPSKSNQSETINIVDFKQNKHDDIKEKFQSHKMQVGAVETTTTKQDPITLKESEIITMQKQCNLKMNKTLKKRKPSNVFIVRRDTLSEDQTSPLRRSRRSKSLYAGVGFQDNSSNIFNEVYQNTPLMKKQLIYTSLLKEKDDLLHSKKLSSEKSHRGFCKNYTERNGTSVKLSTKKRKTINRKKSAKNRLKNKKSIFLSEHAITSNLEENSQSDEKNVLGVTQNKNEMNKDCESLSSSSADQNKSYNLLSKNENVIKTIDKNNYFSLESTDYIDIMKSSCEKRKNSYTGAELSNNHKSKKSKYERCNNDKYDKFQLPSLPTSNFKNKGTTCYSTSPKTYKTRSISAIVNSSGKMYDPYDINLEDMVDTTEPLKQSIFETNVYKIKTRGNKLKKPGFFDKELINRTPCYGVSKLKKNDKNKFITLNEITNSDSVKSSESNYDFGISGIDNTLKQVEKEYISDTDNSSKSDEPLKKYVKKKLVESNNKITLKRLFAKPKNTDEKKKGETYKLNSDPDIQSINMPNKIDEHLRSEQFMESFGFFSERKPRKSNLLASKKISETFHLVADDHDDMFYGTTESGTKKGCPAESKKSLVKRRGKNKSDEDKLVIANIKTKRVQKKETCSQATICYCKICKKGFRRADNYMRHQMTLLHTAKLAQIELKLIATPLLEETNYLITFKRYIDRLRVMPGKFRKRKKNSQILPSLEEILIDVHKTISEQQLCCRDLSRDEVLFIDCCELLKESHKTDILNSQATRIADLSKDSSTFDYIAQSSTTGLELLCKQNVKSYIKDDEDVDSITAKTILESEEVRNLENDLISGLTEAAYKLLNDSQKFSPTALNSYEICPEKVIKPNNLQMEVKELNFEIKTDFQFDKNKDPKVENKTIPDTEKRDIFEDKFDKIKRKCRSQAAAAKQAQIIVKPNNGKRGRTKMKKSKEKKSINKDHQNIVLTKGALKGFDGIKVSIPTSDINMSAIISPHRSLIYKGTTHGGKNKRQKGNSESNCNYIRDHSLTQKNMDVYEFMDNEDAELFEFRSSILMEKFKSTNNKQTPGTLKYHTLADELQKTSESGSDADDFVYMSDDFVCSEDETENSLLLSEIKNNKSDLKKVSPLKRKDVQEKNAVMGKIFKYNAIRSKKKRKTMDILSPKANSDQLFDSLFEEPNTTMLHNDSNPSKNYKNSSIQEFSHTNVKIPQSKIHKKKRYFTDNYLIKVDSKTSKHLSRSLENVNAIDSSSLSSRNIDLTKKCDHNITLCNNNPTTSKTFEGIIQKYRTFSSLKKYEAFPNYHESSPTANRSFSKVSVIKDNKCEDSYKCNFKYHDDPGVTRQRVRRKCTVGKQNVLAETWSSESEPDYRPPRSNRSQSIVTCSGRRKKGKRAVQCIGRLNKVLCKQQDFKSRQSISYHSTSNSSSNSYTIVANSQTTSKVNENISLHSCIENTVATSSIQTKAPLTIPKTSAERHVDAHCSKVRPRTASCYWASEGDVEQGHLQQHGWIVGDSHKKLVTMLAHAKGRKNNNCDKRRLIQ